MSKNTRAVLGAIALVLALAGCSSQATPAEPAQAISTSAAAPTVASSPESTTDAKDAAFVAKVRAVSPDISYTDSELVAYGVIACAHLTSGSETTDVEVLPSSDPDFIDHNGTVVAAAKQQLCP